MNHTEFLNVVDKLKENCNSFGNQVLYDMAKSSDLHNPKQFADAMWIIGRAYAASPQRRSYGTKKDSFPVRPDNDGRGQFFATIVDTFHDFDFPAQLPAFTYDGNVEIDKLRQSVELVLRFNRQLSKAIEEFDCAPEGIHCTNHISFSSKFLHFYYPERVFIIDNYAQAGANLLFGNKGKDHFAYVCNPDCEITYNPLQMNYLQITGGHKQYDFEPDVYDKIVPDNINNIINEFADDYDQRYITHCVRSYFMGAYLKEYKKIFNPMPRLIDTVFLNIKGKLDKTEIDHYCKLADRYKGYAEKYKNDDRKNKTFSRMLEDYNRAYEIRNVRYPDK